VAAAGELRQGWPPVVEPAARATAHGELVGKWRSSAETEAMVDWQRCCCVAPVLPLEAAACHGDGGLGAEAQRLWPGGWQRGPDLGPSRPDLGIQTRGMALLFGWDSGGAATLLDQAGAGGGRREVAAGRRDGLGRAGCCGSSTTLWPRR
jgi:hypothetical protein